MKLLGYIEVFCMQSRYYWRKYLKIRVGILTRLAVQCLSKIYKRQFVSFKGEFVK